jgi:hemoglobin-like flavoprotein
VTPERERLIRESWARLQPYAGSAAAVLYAHLFELDPLSARLFAATDMEAQGRKLIQMLEEIVKVLDQPESLVSQVADLGRRHVGYGVRDADYESLGAALLWTLEDTLGPAFTPEVRDAWSEAYLLLASVMRRAAARTSQVNP